MESKTRIVGIVINEHNEILLQQGYGYEELRTPGGKIDENESELECLKREFLEEMYVEVIGAERFWEFSAKSFYSDHLIVNRVYIAQITGEPKPWEEIATLIRVSKKDYITNRYKMLPGNSEIFDKLIERGIW